MKEWEPQDYLVLFFAVALTMVMVVPLFGEDLDSNSLEVYEKIVIGVLAVISLYVGSKLKK